jgi:hypothetical protein
MTDKALHYKLRCKTEKGEIRRIHRISWDGYVSNLKHGAPGPQSTAHRILICSNRAEMDTAEVNINKEEQSLQHYGDLWYNLNA